MSESVVTLQNLIDGERCAAISGDTYEVENPATGQIYARAPLSGPDDVDRAYRAAAKAFETWGETTPRERSDLLLKLADAMEARTEDLLAAEVKDTGKPYHLTKSEEMPATIDHFRFFAGAARTLEGRAAGEYLADHTSIIRREPIGVVGQVTPWNYPLNMMAWKIAPALAAGNTIVLKPSDTTPAASLLLAEIANEILPPGVLNVIAGDRDTGRAMTVHPIPQMIAITGSVRAGIEVAKAAADDVKKVHLELGGKAPVIVFDDVIDVAAAAAAIAEAGFFNGGQDCTAATRVLVQAGVHDAFVAALVAEAQATKTGLPYDAETAYGALNSADQLARVAGVVDRLPAHAEVAAGGKIATVAGGEEGHYYEATVLVGLNQDDEQIQSEMFGPVITVQKFSDEAEALAWANGVKYGLGSSVWSADHGTAMRMSKRLDFGVVWINTHIPFVSEMPHGGFKHSGHGKDLSVYGLEDYTRIKHVMSYIGR